MAITLRRTITDETPKILEFLKDYTSDMGWELVNGGEIPDKNLTFKRTTLGANYQIGMLGNKVRSIYRAELRRQNIKHSEVVPKRETITHMIVVFMTKLFLLSKTTTQRVHK